MKERPLHEQLKAANQRIEQLCATVNNYANQLGLGRKVRAEDWIVDDSAEAAEQERERAEKHRAYCIKQLDKLGL